MYAALCIFYRFLYLCVHLLCTYTAFEYVCVRLLRTLCGFCVCIRIFCALYADFAYIYGFCARWAASSYIHGLSFAQVVRILRTYMAYLHNVQCGQYRGIRSYGFLDFCFSVWMLVICWQSQGIRSWGFCVFLLSARSAHESLDSLEDPILRVP